MMSRIAFSLLVSVVVFATNAHVLADNWGNWRGPNFDGSTGETKLPVKFSQTENVTWAIDLPGTGASTPVVWGDRVFVTVATGAPDHKILAIAYDRKTGKELWRDEVGQAAPTDTAANKAGPSPTTDGKHVIFFYGSGDLVAYTVEGKRVWKRQLCEEYGDFSFMWSFSSSPIIHNGIGYVPILQRIGHKYRPLVFKEPTESFLLAFEPETGKTLWKHARKSAAQGESSEAFTTIIPYKHDGVDQLLVSGGDCVTGHDPKTGEELWRWGTWNPRKIGHWRLVPSPVAGAGIVLACAPKNEPVYAIKLGGKGDISDSGLAWKSSSPLVSSDVSTPLFMDGKFFVLHSERKAMVCVEPADGKIVWEIPKLPGRAKYEASPAGGDGKIYTISHKGEADVIDAKTGDVLHSTVMVDKGVDNNRPSIVISQGSLFIKVHNKLFCIGGGNLN